MKIKKLLPILIPSIITMLSGCEIYGAKQFNPDIAASDLTTPLSEQFKNYFYATHVDEYLYKNGGSSSQYRYYPEEEGAYSEMKAFTTGSIQLIDLDLWHRIALKRCSKHNGQLYDRSLNSNNLNLICIKNELPIFYIKINEGYNPDIFIGNTKGASGLWGIAAETTNINDSIWLSKAKSEGWTPNFREKDKNTKQIHIAKQREKLKAVQESYSKVKSSKIGTMICKNGNNNGFDTLSIGYIEDKKEDRLKISIARKIYPSLNSVDSGFTPVTIWDSYQNWYLCNYNID